MTSRRPLRSARRARLALTALAAALSLPVGAATAGADAPPLPGHARIGVEVQAMSPELRRHFGAPADRGLLVSRVEPDRPAARAGLRVGDVLLSAGGEPLGRPYDLVRVVGRAPEGGILALRILREGEPLAVEVTPEGRPLPWPDTGSWAEWIERGFELGSREVRERLRELEERLEELERRLEDQRALEEGAERT